MYYSWSEEFLDSRAKQRPKAAHEVIRYVMPDPRACSAKEQYAACYKCKHVQHGQFLNSPPQSGPPLTPTPDLISLAPPVTITVRHLADIFERFMMLATAAALGAAPVFAQEALKEGEAMMVTPQGTMQKSTKMIDDARHEAALKQGAKEVAEGTVFYRHGGKLYNVTCRGQDIGGWKEGYPGTECVC